MISPNHRFFIPLVMCACFVSAFVGAALAVRWAMPPNAGYAPAHAATEVPPAPVPGCEAEVDRLCRHTQMSEGGPVGCLLDFEDQWSDSCRDVMQPHRDRWKACATEVKRFCPGVKQGRMRIPKCLRSHADQLSSACRAALPK